MTHMLTSTSDQDDLRLGGEAIYTADDARAALAGYAFATRTFPTRAVMERPAGEGNARRWGYRSYDCVPASKGEKFSELDLLIPAGLNAHLDVAVLESLRWAAGAAAAPLGRAVHRAASRCVSFWDLDPEELGTTPEEGTVGAALNEAWAACMAVPKIRLARTHKLLHHKAPHLVPLIDRATGPVLSRAASRRNSDETSWQVIHADLQQEGFGDLEGWFAGLADRRSEAPLTRLRIHDILLWLDTIGQRPAAIAAGRGCDGRN